jgi:hypothetical protein
MGWDQMGKSKEKGGLGYREQDCFNQALLAKQGWCLQQNPETLVEKIFLKKYYPGDLFLESSLGKRPFYAWRSIWNVKTLLQEGLI